MLIDVLTALAVVVSVSLILGVLLALFINFFSVAEDEKEKKIRECLPGINCGACGFTGCNEYAKALSNSEAKPNLCIPGAETTAKALSEILGVEVEEPKDVVAFVHCNGTCDAASEKAIYQGVATCKAKSMLYGGSKACSYGCFGCGDCADVCIANAISVENGVAKVDTSLCLGCGLCAKTCPQRIISMVPQEAKAAVFCSSKDKGAQAKKVCANACIGCKKCEKTCEFGAITVVDNCAVIDYEKCTGCGACAQVCPTGCLKNVYLPDLGEN
jgi:Na+-translocating ferredoxin:NAD+ oxidoreductase RNF subunit RnfB